jgi:plasmid maintenance system antidote protein VapI
MKDQRYQAVKAMIETGMIIRLEHIFPIVPKTNVARAINIRPARFNDLINDVGRFTIMEIDALAKLLEVDYSVINKILHDQFQEEQKIKEQKKQAFKSGNKGNKSKAL